MNGPAPKYSDTDISPKHDGTTHYDEQPAILITVRLQIAPWMGNIAHNGKQSGDFQTKGQYRSCKIRTLKRDINGRAWESPSVSMHHSPSSVQPPGSGPKIRPSVHGFY